MVRTYKGWEIAKMISEGKLEEGTILFSNSSTFTVLRRCLTRQETEGGKEVGNSYLIDRTRTFTIQRKKCSFTDAFKAYEEGKEIESCYTGTKFCDDEYLKDDIVSDWRMGVAFKSDEIRNDWYINEKE